jgi:hypothetical protein
MFIRRTIRQKYPRARLAVVLFCSVLALAGMMLILLTRL